MYDEESFDRGTKIMGNFYEVSQLKNIALLKFLFNCAYVSRNVITRDVRIDDVFINSLYAQELLLKSVNDFV